MVYAGIDIGTSLSKVVVFQDGTLMETLSGCRDLSELSDRYAPDIAGLTGVGAVNIDKSAVKFPVYDLLEIDSITAGVEYLTGLEDFLAVSIGTGTAFILRQHGRTTHIGGTAFGGGALEGLSRKILGGGIGEKLLPLCKTGDLSRTDLLMGELPSCTPTLDPAMTASNLAKTGPDTRDEDWAIGILNLVVETVGSMACLTAIAYGVKDVVFTGGITAVPETKKILTPFSDMYPVRFRIPNHSDCANAVGAAVLARENSI